VYLKTATQLLRVIDNRPSPGWPGIPTGATIAAAAGSIYAQIVGPSAHIVVNTDLTVSGATHFTVLYWNGVQWFEISAGGQVADTLLTGMNLTGQIVVLSGGAPYMSGNGDTAALAATPPAALTGVTWVEFGGALNDNGRTLLRYKNGAKVGLAYWTGGELLQVDEADAMLTPGFAEFDHPGRSGALNDADQMTWRATSAGTDGSVGTADDVQEVKLGTAQ
jgi:hypothetical protein